MPDSHEIWFGILGPGIAARGAVVGGPPVTASQFAQTIASLLGHPYVADHPVGKKIELQTR